MKKELPETMFCPTCGASIKLTPLKEEGDLKQRMEAGNYIAGARFACKCKTVGILLKKDPKNPPVWTLLFEKVI